MSTHYQNGQGRNGRSVQAAFCHAQVAVVNSVFRTDISATEQLSNYCPIKLMQEMAMRLIIFVRCYLQRKAVALHYPFRGEWR